MLQQSEPSPDGEMEVYMTNNKKEYCVYKASPTGIQRPVFYGNEQDCRKFCEDRDFTYIDNVIEANLKACLAPSEAAGEAFNIGAGGREYLIDVYHDLCKALGKEVEPNLGPNRAGDIRDSNADISKAKELLGYDPEYDFEKGINLAIDWYKENLA